MKSETRSLSYPAQPGAFDEAGPAPVISVSWFASVGGRLVVDGLVWIAALLLFAPLLLTIYLSFFDSNIIAFPPAGYTLRWYNGIITEFGKPLYNSCVIAFFATIGSLSLGVIAALALSRGNWRGRAFFASFLLSPLSFPGIALGLGIYIYLVSIQRMSGVPLVGSYLTLILGHILITLPWVVRLCVSGLANFDRSIEEAAASLGAKPYQVLLRVTLPAIQPTLVAAALFSFVVSFENLEMSMFLISPGMTTITISVLQYLQFRLDPLVAAAATVQIVIVLLGLLILNRFVKLGRVL